MKLVKFDLNWFRLNKDSADKILNFSQELLWFKQNVICKLYENRAEFYLLDKSKRTKGEYYPILAKLGSIKIEDNFVWAVNPLKNEKVWIIAEKLGYYKFPRTWIRISKWFKKEFVRYCFKRKNEKVICYLKDKFGNRFYLPIETIKDMNFNSKKLLKQNSQFTKYSQFLLAASQNKMRHVSN